MIRHRFVTLAGLCMMLLVAPARAQNEDQLYTASKLQLDVTKVLLAQETAWNKGDLDGYLSHFKDAEDTRALLGAPVRGLQHIRDAFHNSFPNRESMGTLENSEVEVRALGENFALATGRYRLVRSKKGGGNLEGIFTEVMEKTPAGWQVIFSEST